MEKAEFVEMLKSMTKEEWKEVDQARNSLMRPSPAELELQQQATLDLYIREANKYLANYGMVVLGIEKGKDLEALYRTYIFGDGTKKNPNIQEFWGDEKRLKERFNAVKKGSILDFCKMVIEIEQ